MPEPRTFNQQVENVIAESTKPELVRLLLTELDAGTLDEKQQQAAMALLQDYGVDLFDLGVAMLSDKSQSDLERIARSEMPDPGFQNWGRS
jgi:hypothetical protein